MNTEIEKWNCFGIELNGPRDGNPFQDVTLTAVFRHRDSSVEVNGFYDGDGVYRIRFMPDLCGPWSFVTKSDVNSLDCIEGTFVCVENTGRNHGPVQKKGQFHFQYADGTSYYPFGTTCYAWIHQTSALQDLTLKTLEVSPFNKLRMCVFPKHYDYNHNEPDLYPFEGSLVAGFNFTRLEPSFFRHLEKRILDLQFLGIECDLILFHPYDRWGFSDMGPQVDGAYLKYIVSRLAAFRNIWWSMANEYDLFLREDGSLKKDIEEWDRLARIIQRYDPNQHFRSIHNCFKLFDHGKPWVTHSSIQRTDHFKTAENTAEWRSLYGKPVVIDECAYEGNINHGWGNISGQEMVRRFWEGVVRGGYVSHGETYMHPEDVLWWSHGGELHGSSPVRIAFLRKILEDAPGPLNPVTKPLGALFDPNWDSAVGSFGDEYVIYYYGFCQPAFRNFNLPSKHAYYVDLIDTWDMAVERLEGTFSGQFSIKLPGKQFMAIRMVRDS